MSTMRSAVAASILACPSCGTRFRDPGLAPGKSCRCGRCREVFVPGAAANRVYRLRGASSPSPSGPTPGTASAPLRDLRIGMDDPSLADRLRETSLSADPGTPPAAMTYRVFGDVEARPVGDTNAAAGTPEGTSKDAGRGPLEVVDPASLMPAVEAPATEQPAGVDEGSFEGPVSLHDFEPPAALAEEAPTVGAAPAVTVRLGLAGVDEAWTDLATAAASAQDLAADVADIPEAPTRRRRRGSVAGRLVGGLVITGGLGAAGWYGAETLGQTREIAAAVGGGVGLLVTLVAVWWGRRGR